MEKKLTAVEWLKSVTLDSKKPIYQSDLEKLFEQAKQMEREQMIDFADAYANDVMGGCMKPASDYFTQTYKQ